MGSACSGVLLRCGCYVPEQEVIEISPDRLPGYADKIKSFYEEHIHTDEEIRYILDGRGELGGMG